MGMGADVVFERRNALRAQVIDRLIAEEGQARVDEGGLPVAQDQDAVVSLDVHEVNGQAVRPRASEEQQQKGQGKQAADQRM